MRVIITLILVLGVATPAIAGGILDDIEEIFEDDDVSEEVGEACEDNPSLCLAGTTAVFQSFAGLLTIIFTFVNNLLAAIFNSLFVGSTTVSPFVF
jgi:hypothetical protein